MTPLIYTAPDLCRLFAHDNTEALRKYLHKLEAEKAFPKPFTPGRWSRFAVDAWARTHGLAAPYERHPGEGPALPANGNSPAADIITRLEQVYAR